VFRQMASLPKALAQAKAAKSRLTPLLHFQGQTAKSPVSFSLPKHPPSTFFALLAINATGSGTNMDIGQLALKGAKASQVIRAALPVAGCAEPLRYADYHDLFTGEGGGGADGAPPPGQLAMQLLFGAAAPPKHGATRPHAEVNTTSTVEGGVSKQAAAKPTLLPALAPAPAAGGGAAASNWAANQ